MDKPQSLEIFTLFLAKKGLYNTLSRRLIAEAALKKTDPFDVQQLWVELQKSHIGMATLYRTLALLEEAGLIRRIAAEIICYEAIYDRPKHELLHCSVCGKWVKFYSQQLEEDLDTVSERFGFAILERNIVLKGICQDCREANSNHPASHLE